jgi:hypothetical protein
MRSTSLAFAALATLALSACATGGEDDFEEEDDYVDPGVQATDGKTDASSSVQSVVSATCSTAPVRGLSLQIAEEMRCLAPGLLVPFNETSTIQFTTQAVLPYLSADTAAALAGVGTLEINSSLRSVAQQYLIRKWRDAGRCGIRAAASPGRSNHETGRAVDLDNDTQAKRAMLRAGFSTLRNDPVHFEHLDSPDLRSTNVQAFQRLWNRNHPEDRIAETGTYTTQTAVRLGRAPAGGFRIGADCD